MLKLFLLTIISVGWVSQAGAQYLWYENETDTNKIILTTSQNGIFTTGMSNPSTTGNSNTVVSQFIREADSSKGFTYFRLLEPVLTAENYSVTLKAYIDMPTEALTSQNSRIRLYLEASSGVGSVAYEQLKFSQGQTWEEFTFTFDTADFDEEVFAAGGYDQLTIGYGNGSYSEAEITYYVDSIYGWTELTTELALNNVDWMVGSWGVRLNMDGGEKLNASIEDGYDYVEGAKQIVASYPDIGHVITSFTHPADGSYFTLRSNDNVDVVTELGETFVPTLENEKIILEVLEIFREADIKVILYLNGGGPSLRASDERVAIWNDYVERKFAGDEHAAWMDLAQGYASRFSGLVDGYWVDALGSYPGTRAEIPAFVQMLRDSGENLAITANLDKDYFTDEAGEFLYVDSDGLNDSDATDYKIIKYESTDTMSDYTSGHITPLGQGAPPNSWGYEEFTIPNIQENPTSVSTDYKKLVLKHMFLPIREKWSNERVDIVFGKDDALRFVKNITAAGGSVTFSTTNLYGLPMQDELEILTHVNEQMSADIPEVTEYARPQGAFLVGEAHIYPWYENEALTDEDYIIHAQTVDGQFLDNAANPKKTGINSSATAARLKRDKGDNPSVSFTLPNPVTDLASLQLNFDAYARIDSSELTSVAATITVALTHTRLGETAYQQLTFAEGKTWEAFVIDFSAQTIPDAVLSAGGYDQLSIGFALGDDSDDITNYYFDNLTGSINQNITQ